MIIFFTCDYNQLNACSICWQWRQSNIICWESIHFRHPSKHFTTHQKISAGGWNPPVCASNIIYQQKQKPTRGKIEDKKWLLTYLIIVGYCDENLKTFPLHICPMFLPIDFCFTCPLWQVAYCVMTVLDKDSMTKQESTAMLAAQWGCPIW